MLYASLRREIQTIRQQELYLENQGSYPKTCLEPFFTVSRLSVLSVSSGTVPSYLLISLDPTIYLLSRLGY
jgi:hypothetical protein